MVYKKGSISLRNKVSFLDLHWHMNTDWSRNQIPQSPTMIPYFLNLYLLQVMTLSLLNTSFSGVDLESHFV